MWSKKYNISLSRNFTHHRMTLMYLSVAFTSRLSVIIYLFTLFSLILPPISSSQTSTVSFPFFLSLSLHPFLFVFLKTLFSHKFTANTCRVQHFPNNTLRIFIKTWNKMKNKKNRYEMQGWEKEGKKCEINDITLLKAASFPPCYKKRWRRTLTHTHSHWSKLLSAQTTGGFVWDDTSYFVDTTTNFQSACSH